MPWGIKEELEVLSHNVGADFDARAKALKKLEDMKAELSKLGDLIEPDKNQSEKLLQTLGYTKISADGSASTKVVVTNKYESISGITVTDESISPQYSSYTNYKVEDGGETVKTESTYVKLVKRDCADEVKEKENKFKQNYRLYCEVTENYTMKKPNAVLAFVFQILAVLYSFAIVFFVFAQPSFYSDNQALQQEWISRFADYYLFQFIPDYLTLFPKSVTELLAIFSSVLFIPTLALSIVLSKYGTKGSTKLFLFPLITYLCAMGAFGMTAIMDYFPPFWFLALAARLVVLVWGAVYFIYSLINIFTNGTYRKLSRNVNARTEFYESGEFENTQNLLSDILSYNVKIPSDLPVSGTTQETDDE